MATNTSRLIILRAQTSHRYLSTVSSTAAAEATVKDGTVLFRKLIALRRSETSNMTGILDDWTKDGKSLSRLDIVGYVSQLRRFKKYTHAIQLYEWMDKSNNKLNNADHAIRMDLLAKTEGVASAENYFNNLEESAKTNKTYGALLNCYCKEDLLEKATDLFKKMTKLNLNSNPLHYNNLMALYLRVGQAEQVPLLAKEMEEKKIPKDLYTYNQLINAYASLKDFGAIDGVLEMMKTTKVKRDWFTIANLATIYVNEGIVDKAKDSLQKLEKFSNLQDFEAFHTLIRLYACISDLAGVNRAWESLKRIQKKTVNTSYLIMLLSLNKLGDVDGIEKCFREWESSCSTYDMRVANVLLESYLKRDMIEEANKLYESAVKRGAEAKLRTLHLFISFYSKNSKMDLALQYLERAPSTVNTRDKTKWFPEEETIVKFLKYFEEEKDVDSAEKFYTSMKKLGRVDSRIFTSLLLTYKLAGKVEPNLRQRINEDGIEITSEAENLLNEVCPKEV